MFKKISSISSYKEYNNYVEKLRKLMEEAKEKYNKGARNFDSNFRIVVNAKKLINEGKSFGNEISTVTRDAWNTYNKGNVHYEKYKKLEKYINTLTSFVENTFNENLTQTNKYWLSLFINILNDKTEQKWRAVNISTTIKNALPNKAQSNTETYICLINDKTDLNSLTLKTLDTQYRLYTLDLTQPRYEMDNNELLFYNSDKTNLIVYDKAVLSNKYLKENKTYENPSEQSTKLHYIPAARQYKSLTNGVYNHLWEKVLKKSNELEQILVETQSQELE